MMLKKLIEMGSGRSGEGRFDGTEWVVKQRWLIRSGVSSSDPITLGNRLLVVPSTKGLRCPVLFKTLFLIGVLFAVSVSPVSAQSSGDELLNRLNRVGAQREVENRRLDSLINGVLWQPTLGAIGISTADSVLGRVRAQQEIENLRLDSLGNSILWQSKLGDAGVSVPDSKPKHVGYDFLLSPRNSQVLDFGKRCRKNFVEYGMLAGELDDLCDCLTQKVIGQSDSLFEINDLDDVLISNCCSELSLDCGGLIPTLSEEGVWLAIVTRTVDCREGPGTSFNVIGTYRDSARLIVESLDATNGYYPVFDLSQGLSGWVHTGCVEIIQEMSYSTGGILNSVGEVLSDNAFVEVENDAGRPISIRFDDGLSPEFIVIADGEVRELILKPGQYRMVASTATPSNVEHYIGFEELKSGIQYSWIFVIR